MRIVILLIAVLLFSCSKYEDRLLQQNQSSGIVQVTQHGVNNIKGAKIDEVVTVYAKIGTQGSTVSIFVGGVEAKPLSHGSRSITVKAETGSNTMQVLVDTFDIKIPAEAKIGRGILYFTLDGKPAPALAFEVFRPDILVPGKSFVDPFLYSYMDSVKIENGSYQYTTPNDLRDGVEGKAVINTVLNLTYDENTNTFYFIDKQPSDGSYRIRKLNNGTVTTIAGGGNNYLATDITQLKLTGVTDLKVGPDGQIYYACEFLTDPDPVTLFGSRYAFISRLNPATGKVEKILGANRVIEKYYSRPYDDYLGIEDGPQDSAMIYYPQSLTFDKAGNLYFIDGAADYSGSGSLLRRFTKEGRLETVLGRVNKDVYDFEDADGITYKVPVYSPIEAHDDGFGDEVRLFGAAGLVQAGNGKFYIPCSGAGWHTNIVEVNVDTREASTIIGMPDGNSSSLRTGTFREVDLAGITTFDLDYDGNILFGQGVIYKINLQQEVIAKLAGGGTTQENLRTLVKHRQPGETAILSGTLSKIVFDQFGNLYVGYMSNTPPTDMKISKIIIEH
jgi:hypothetical protein